MDGIDPLSFVADRMTVLQAAHKIVSGWDIDYEVSDVLDMAGWLAGDDLPSLDDDSPAPYWPAEPPATDGAEDA